MQLRAPALAFALAVSSLLVAPVAAQATAASPCATMGAATTIGTTSIPTCRAFFSSGAAIHVPADTTSEKYGTLLDGGLFTTRTGTTIPSSGVAPVATGATSAQIVVRATVRAGRVTSVTPYLYVANAAVTAQFSNRAFVGTVRELAPASGVSGSPWFRLDFGSVAVNGVLNGTVRNLATGVREAGSAVCHPALEHDAATMAWFRRFLGPDRAFTARWFPAMHHGDSEFSPTFSSGISYMAALPTVASLLASPFAIPSTLTLTIHGNPVGTLLSFVGQVRASGATSNC